MTTASRRKKFGIQNLTEGGLEVDVLNAVDVVQGPVDSGASKSVWPIRIKCERQSSDTCGRRRERDWNLPQTAKSAT